ncbi:hypothetical protein [Candidatus Nitrosocosmicus franklandus]|uniref:Uncharacterized protein n=1 Tax=Candidatus Nitrosocosmicus franklandianus TaxID=1798806 RepID=A0A484I753_9ARCH|nr:hypothetical protein [Candidatus Nitrosocosmicus franklandus]VFJ13001.1 conserved protein of unknown function [Candidatus Nitrosocosmicus franklandus]
MIDKRSIATKQFIFTYIVTIFLVTVPLVGSGISVLGQNATMPYIVNETIIDDYYYYGQPIYYTEDEDDDDNSDSDNDNSNEGNNYYYIDNNGKVYYKDENNNFYYTDVEGHHYWYDNDGHKYYCVDHNHNQKFYYDDNGNKVAHDEKGDSRTAYDSHSSGTHVYYSIFNNGNHVQLSGGGSFIHHDGIIHDHSSGGLSPQSGFSLHEGEEFRGHGGR